MNKLERYIHILKDIGLILGIPVVITIGVNLYNAQIKALELKNSSLEQTQYDDALALINAQNTLHKQELLRLINLLKLIKNED